MRSLSVNIVVVTLLASVASAADVDYSLFHAYEACQDGDYETAVQEYETVLKVDPVNIKALLGLGRAFEALERLDEAVAAYDRAIAVDPERAEPWVEKARILKNTGDSEDALVCYERALALEPGKGLLHDLTLKDAAHEYEGLLEELKLYDKLIARYDSVLKDDPTNTTAWVRKARALRDAGHGEQASMCLDQIMELEPAGWEEMLAIGWVFEEFGRLSEADAIYDKVFSLGIRSPSEWKEVSGRFVMGREDYPRALAAIEKALALGPADVTLWDAKARIYLAMGDEPNYRACIERILELQPEDTMALMSRARDLYGQGRKDEAFACLEKVVAAVPDDASAFNSAAHTLLIWNEFEKALNYYERALALEPNNYDSWFNKGLAHAGGGQYEDALTCLDRSYALEPGFYLAAITKGSVLCDIGRYDEAIVVYDAVIAENPEGIEVALLYKADALVLFKDYDGATTIYDTLLRDAPGEPRLLYEKAYVAILARRYGDAYQTYLTLALASKDARDFITAYVVSVYAGQTDPVLLEQALAAANGDEWPAPAALFLLGRATEEELMAARGDNQDRHCSGEFYLGLAAKMAGDAEGARRHFEIALDLRTERTGSDICLILAGQELGK